MLELNTAWLQQRKYRFRELDFWTWAFRCTDNETAGIVVLYQMPGISEMWRVQYCESAKCAYVYFDADYNVTRVVIDNETYTTVTVKREWHKILTPILRSIAVIYAL